MSDTYSGPWANLTAAGFREIQLAVIRVALEAAAEACRSKADEISTKRPDGRAQHFTGAQVGALTCVDAIIAISVDDIMKRLEK